MKQIIKVKINEMKLFTVDFKPLYSVSAGLIILAIDDIEAIKIARGTLKHTKDFTIKEVLMNESKVVFYESGNY